MIRDQFFVPTKWSPLRYNHKIICDQFFDNIMVILDEDTQSNRYCLMIIQINIFYIGLYWIYYRFKQTHYP